MDIAETCDQSSEVNEERIDRFGGRQGDVELDRVRRRLFLPVYCPRRL